MNEKEYELYYLADQSSDDIYGDKVSIAYFETPEECHAKAVQEGIAHYSIELESGTTFSIIFVC